MSNEDADVMHGDKNNRLNGDVSKELCLKKKTLRKLFFVKLYIVKFPIFDDKMGCEYYSLIK